MVAVPSSEVEAAAAAAGIDGGAVTAGEAGEEEEFELEDVLVDGELARRSQSAGEPRLVDGEGSAASSIGSRPDWRRPSDDCFTLELTSRF